MTRRNRITRILFSIAALLATGTAAVRAQSALDGFDPNANGPVYVIVVQPDGKILIGGLFTTLAPNGGPPVTRNHIARLNPDGTLDAAFDPNANGTVRSIALQADGKILAGGTFTSIGAQPRNCIARLDATTGLADSFDPSANFGVLRIVVQGDGKILVGGDFTNIGGQPRNNIARLDAVTGLADFFNPNANNSVRAIAVQADGKILVGGDFTSVGGQARNYIARLEASTGLADSFNPNATHDSFPSVSVNEIVVQTDGRILAGGTFDTIGGQARNNIARLDAITGLADSFNPNASNSVQSIAVQADGKILVGGRFGDIGDQIRRQIARLDATTGLADSFAPNLSPHSSGVPSIAMQADGKILVGGDFTTVAPSGAASITRNYIARLETDGRVDQALISPVETVVYATAVQPDGKILIGGLFSTVLGVTRNNIARLNTDGTLDTAFNPSADGVVFSIAVQPDGKILVGGGFTVIGGQTRNSIARLDATTGVADAFDPNPTAGVVAIAVQADGKILVGGHFMSIGGQPRNRIARLDAITGLADSFNPNASGSVLSLAVQTDGKILVGGEFTGANSIGGQPRNRIARLDATTGLADSFNPNASDFVFAIAVQADGKILVGGQFTNIGQQPRNRIARLDATTGLADSFNPNANDSVGSIAMQADGKILASGGFTSIGGQERNSIVRLDATTGLADSFNPNANNWVHSIAMQADGKILAGGQFTTIGGQARGHFARLSNDTPALQDLVVMRTAISWTRGGSSPQLRRVTFESSNDNVNYTPLGSGIPQSGSSNWTLTGLSLPTGQNIYIRARGYYRSGSLNSSESITESVRIAFLADTSTLGNISTRMRVETGDNVLIGGFIVTGTQPKKVIVRAIGPSLRVPGKLENPTLELYGPAGLITSNDNWQDAPNRQEIIDSTVPPTNDLESAIVTTLPANGTGYTAIVRGASSGTGVGLVEVYDLDRTVDSKLANISSRGFVQTDDNVMIGGFIVVGTGTQRVIVRAIGPSLPVPGALADPTLELYDSNGMVIASNDNWRSDQEAEIIASTVPPTNDLESAIVATLPADWAHRDRARQEWNNRGGSGRSLRAPLASATRTATRCAGLVFDRRRFVVQTGATASMIARMPKVFVALLLILTPLGAFAETALWQDVNPASIAVSGKRPIRPNSYRTVRLNREALVQLLAQAPMEFTQRRAPKSRHLGSADARRKDGAISHRGIARAGATRGRRASRRENV